MSEETALSGETALSQEENPWQGRYVTVIRMRRPRCLNCFHPSGEILPCERWLK